MPIAGQQTLEHRLQESALPHGLVTGDLCGNGLVVTRQPVGPLLVQGLGVVLQFGGQVVVVAFGRGPAVVKHGSAPGHQGGRACMQHPARRQRRFLVDRRPGERVGDTHRRSRGCHPQLSELCLYQPLHWAGQVGQLHQLRERRQWAPPVAQHRESLRRGDGLGRQPEQRRGHRARVRGGRREERGCR